MTSDIFLNSITRVLNEVCNTFIDLPMKGSLLMFYGSEHGV